jgi:hypothetical protein
MPESVIEYACRTLDEKEGRRQAREVVLEVLAEIDLPADDRRRLLSKLREAGAI